LQNFEFKSTPKKERSSKKKKTTSDKKKQLVDFYKFSPKIFAGREKDRKKVKEIQILQQKMEKYFPT
jgi:hypothetical protein